MNPETYWSNSFDELYFEFDELYFEFDELYLEFDQYWSIIQRGHVIIVAASIGSRLSQVSVSEGRKAPVPEARNGTLASQKSW